MNKKTALIIVSILLLLAACAPKAEKPAEPQPVKTNVTTESGGIELGDLVSINFVLYLPNGTVADTNNETLAEQNNITNYVKGPYTFILGESGKVRGFDEALIGMKEGEHREVIIPPSEKEVVLSINRTKALPRLININRKQAFPRTSFENYFGKAPVIGDTVFSDKFVFKYKIINITDENVIAKMILKEGEEYVLPSTEWKSKVTKVAEDDAIFSQEPKQNQTLTTPFGPATINLTPSVLYITFNPELNTIFNKSVELPGHIQIPQQFQIIAVRDQDFIIKRYGSLADKKLRLLVDLLNVTKDVKEVKPSKSLMSEQGNILSN